MSTHEAPLTNLSPTLRLERLITRMLFDPSLVSEVYERPERLLEAGALTTEEHTWLTAIDPRRWRADAERPHRALEGLLLHLPVSVALTLKAGLSPQALLGFTSSPEFHQAISNRALLSEAFGAWLICVAPQRWSHSVRSIVSVECAIARLKAIEERPTSATLPLSDDVMLRLSPFVSLITLPQGTLELYLTLAERLKGHGPLGALNPNALGELPAELDELLGDPLHVLAERVGAEVTLSEPPEALAELLSHAVEGAQTSHLLAHIQRRDVSEGDAREILTGLAQEGLLSSAL